MNELISKLSSYNIFNYLLPGIVYVAVLSRITRYDLQQDNLLIGGFLYYFIGLVISRIGSLIIEPVLKKMKLVTFADYKSFVKASATDPRLEILSEANNTYRTLAALFILLILTKIFELAAEQWTAVSAGTPWLILLALFVLFVCAYRKQTLYIKKRIEQAEINQ